jgi:hypothetical protein
MEQAGVQVEMKFMNCNTHRPPRQDRSMEQKLLGYI